jgi:uncharacterized protein (DUF1778 family)
MPLSKKPNNSRLEFRLNGDERALIEQAASVTGQSLTEYAVSHLVRASREVLAEHQHTQLSNRDRELFLRLIDDDARPNDALRRAAARYRKHRAAHRK